MKKYNVEYIVKGSSDGEPLDIILSEHCFLFFAFWTAYNLLSRQSKIKIVKINKYKYIDGLQVSRNFFKLEKM
jgi:hypothetical protein